MIMGDDSRSPVPHDINCFCVVMRPFMGLDEEDFVRAACALIELFNLHSVREMPDDFGKIGLRPDIVIVIVKRQRIDPEGTIKQYS
jgi:hypothetical protein